MVYFKWNKFSSLNIFEVLDTMSESISKKIFLAFLTNIVGSNVQIVNVS